MTKIEAILKITAVKADIEPKSYIDFMKEKNSEFGSPWDNPRPNSTLYFLLFDKSYNEENVSTAVKLSNNIIHKITDTVYDFDHELLVNDIDIKTIIERFCEAVTVKEIWLYFSKDSTDLKFDIEIPNQNGIYSAKLGLKKNNKKETFHYYINSITPETQLSNSEAAQLVADFRKPLHNK